MDTLFLKFSIDSIFTVWSIRVSQSVNWLATGLNDRHSFPLQVQVYF